MDRDYIYKDEFFYYGAKRYKYICIVDKLKLARSIRIAWLNEMIKQKKLKFVCEY